jgi:hypothetical protein
VTQAVFGALGVHDLSAGLSLSSLTEYLSGKRLLLATQEVYHVTMVTTERMQTGLRIERTTLKVLKGLAEYLDLSLGDLVEGIVLHAFEGKAPFGPPVLTKIDQLKAIYGLTLTAADAHKLREQP